MQHRLSNRDTEALTATCAVCGPVSIRKHGQKFKCSVAVLEKSRRQEVSRTPRERNLRYGHRRIAQERLEAGKCERCPYVAEDLCQLDVDHIVRRVDGGTDELENLVILCANCHRLKTRLEKLPGFRFSDFMKFGA